MFGIALRGASKSHPLRPKQARLRRVRLECLEERVLLTLSGNQLFPADSPWNQKIANAPVAANSDTLVASIGASGRLHPDFGTMYDGALIGIPYNIVSASQPKINVVIDAYADESDLLPVPIPNNAIIEGDPLSSSQNDTDRHLIVYDKDQNVVYELFNVRRPTETSDQMWHADSEAVWNLGQNSFRTPGDTSADAAGLPILPGLVRPDEVLDQGVINHALRFTVPRSRNSYVFPASHQAGVNDSSLPRMGERFRLKQSFNISSYSATDRVILQALKEYGMIVADNGSGWYLSGEPSTRWNDDDLHDLTQVLGSNFEAVNLSPIVSGLGQSSGATTGGTQVTIQGKNFSGAAGQLKVLFGTTLATNVTIVSDTTLIATSPAHAAGTVDVKVQTPYGTSATSNADRFTYGVATGSTVTARNVFYNNSFYDTPPNDPGRLSNDTAIATDKLAYLPGGGTSNFANYTTYDKGINGLMIDLTAGGNHAALTAADFTFKVSAQGLAGQSSNPSDGSWTTLTGASLPSVVYRAAGTAVSPLVGYAGNVLANDRIELVWPDNTIVDRWLEVIVKNNANTGLAAQDVFFYGNMPGDTNNDPTGVFKTIDATDQNNIKIAATNPNNTGLYFSYPLSAAISNLWDVNRDGDVNANDQLAAKIKSVAPYGELDMINVSNSGPFAPSAALSDGAGAAVASALAGSGGGNSPKPVGSWLANSGIANSLSVASPVASSSSMYFAQLGHPSSSLVAFDASESSDPLPLDEDLLDVLASGLTA